MPRSCRRARRSLLEAVASHRCTGTFGELNCGDADTLAPGLDEHGLVPTRWPNSQRQSSAVPKATGTHAAVTPSAPSGMTHVVAPVPRRVGVDPDGIVATTRWPTAGQSRVRQLDDRAGALVADDVVEYRPARPVQRVAPSMLLASTSMSTRWRATGSGTSS